MVTDEGRVKVLDFGLAKLAESPFQGGGEGGASEAETATVTAAGKILGTVAYMSPEQAEGKSVDARSDVFALGVLLYEMASGSRPFEGDTPISTITAILRDMPPALTDVRQNLPRHLSRIVNHCLAKEPDRRYQSALDVRNELDELRRLLFSLRFLLSAKCMEPERGCAGRLSTRMDLRWRMLSLSRSPTRIDPTWDCGTTPRFRWLLEW